MMIHTNKVFFRHLENYTGMTFNPDKPFSQASVLSVLRASGQPLPSAFIGTAITLERRDRRRETIGINERDIQRLMTAPRTDGQLFWTEQTDVEKWRWKGWEDDIDYIMTHIAPLLDSKDKTFTDEELRKYIHPGQGKDGRTFEEFFTQSETFQLLNSTTGLAEGNTETPMNHILLVFEKLETEGLNADEKSMVRWVVFFHDLAKVVGPRHAGHGIGSGYIARSFFEEANRLSEEHGMPARYSQEFINKIVQLCRYHHAFAEFISLCEDHCTHLESIGRDVHKFRELLRAFNTIGNDGEDLNSLYDYVVKTYGAVINSRDVEAIYPELTQDKNKMLLRVLTTFTHADVASNPVYDAKYSPRNKLLGRGDFPWKSTS